jgi:pimeloyl-ACP methyl ester carboxylesterase
MGMNIAQMMMQNANQQYAARSNMFGQLGAGIANIGGTIIAGHGRVLAARQLRIKNIPVMIMAAEASYHQAYDHCTAKYLNQAGVKTEYIRLQDKGIHGNGHMVMIEKNNLDIARVIDEWVVKNVK